MDIWAWVNEAIDSLFEQGERRLAELMERISEVVCDHDHDEVDAIYPEALALARASGNPWVEVFVRHWNLQSRILNRMEVGDWMGEAVDLLEFANRPETKGCPQSVCVTQDLVNGYAHIDGPGFAEARLSAADETLARIDPTWPCFHCISAERICALRDAGRLEEAHSFAEQQVAALMAAGEEDPLSLGYERIATLMRLGRFEDAYALLRRVEQDDEDEGYGAEQEFVLLKALLLAQMGRHEEALQARLDFEEIEPTCGLYPEWAECTVLLARAGAVPNDWTLEAELAALQRRLTAQGVVRISIRIALWRGELALSRVRPETAALACAQIEALVPRLHQPLDAPDELLALQRDTEEMLDDLGSAAAALPDDPAAVVSDLARDPEVDLPVLEAACVRWPEHEGLVLATASTLEALSRGGQALAVLEAFAQEQPELEDVPAAIFELTARLHGRPAALTAAREMLSRGVSPEAEVQIRGTLAMAAEAADELGEAMAQMDAIIALQPEPGPYDVMRLVIGSRLRRWDAVRESGARLGLPLEPGDERPEPEMFAAPCAILKLGEDGIPSVKRATRTGPATALITEAGPADDPLNWGDEIVFDPDEVLEEGERPLLRWVAELERGAIAVLQIDADDAGAEALEALRSALKAIGLSLEPAEIRHHAHGRVGEPMARSWASTLAIMDAAILSAVYERVGEIAEGWPGRLSWSVEER